MYEKMYKRVTPNGITVDKCIQPSVDSTGQIVGLVAGDEESYTVDVKPNHFLSLNYYCS